MIFSIIIAAYNVVDYIKQAIESCINQIGIDIDKYEIIVINDGSTDNTGDIVNEYKNKKNVKIVHQNNKGLSGTRNYGIEISKGDYILFLDGDDWLLPETLFTLLPYTGSYDLLVFPLTYWYSSNNSMVNSFGLEERAYSTKEFLRCTIGKQKLNIIPAPCKCYKKGVLIDKHQRFIEGILHEDNPFFVDTIVNFNRIRYIERGLYVYRQNRQGSITSSQTLRNFNGTIVGIKHATKITQYKIKEINYVMTCWHVFQVLLKYNNSDEYKRVLSYYRNISVKWSLIKMIVYCTFVPKQIIRTFLLILDPILLSKFGDLLYGKDRIK